MSSIAVSGGRVGLGEEEKNNGGIMSLMVNFKEAVKKDDIKGTKALLLTCTETEIETWPENPLHFVCEHGSPRMAREIGGGWPKLAILPNQDGDTPMHLVSAKGDVKMVEFLGKLNPGSCLVENMNSMIPLHIAVEKGHCLVIRQLVSLCPESLKNPTSKQDEETVFHLAVNKSQIGAFQVLVDEAKKLNLGHILNKKNNEGNTVLHIAAFKRLTDIVKLLLLESSSSSSHIKIQVNAKNNWGLTALDMCPANSVDIASREISLILQKVAHDDEISSLESQQKCSRVALTRLPVATRNVLLVVLVMIAAAAFSVTCNLPDALLKEIYRSSLTLHANASDVVSGRLPSVIYLMTFNSAAFVICMLVISYILWPLPLRSILLFAVVCTCIVYFILVDKVTPKLSIRAGNFSFSSIAWVLSSALAFIFCGVTIIIICTRCSVFTCS